MSLFGYVGCTVSEYQQKNVNVMSGRFVDAELLFFNVFFTERMDAQTDVADAPSCSGVDDTIGDPYCFESDHLALKGNPDYHKLLRTICVLEAQRSKALEDLELLHEAEEKVLKFTEATFYNTANFTADFFFQMQRAASGFT